jgi:hypothetical protein
MECGKIIGDRLLSSKTPELPRLDRAAALEAKFAFPKTKKPHRRGSGSGVINLGWGRAIRGTCLGDYPLIHRV